MDTYIPPNVRLINPISKRVTTNQRFTSDELPTWLEQSQDLMLISFIIRSLGTNDLSSAAFMNYIGPHPTSKWVMLKIVILLQQLY